MALLTILGPAITDDKEKGVGEVEVAALREKIRSESGSWDREKYAREVEVECRAAANREATE